MSAAIHDVVEPPNTSASVENRTRDNPLLTDADRRLMALLNLLIGATSHQNCVVAALTALRSSDLQYATDSIYELRVSTRALAAQLERLS